MELKSPEEIKKELGVLLKQQKAKPVSVNNFSKQLKDASMEYAKLFGLELRENQVGVTSKEILKEVDKAKKAQGKDKKSNNYQSLGEILGEDEQSCSGSSNGTEYNHLNDDDSEKEQLPIGIPFCLRPKKHAKREQDPKELSDTDSEESQKEPSAEKIMVFEDDGENLDKQNENLTHLQGPITADQTTQIETFREEKLKSMNEPMYGAGLQTQDQQIHFDQVQTIKQYFNTQINPTQNQSQLLQSEKSNGQSKITNNKKQKTLSQKQYIPIESKEIPCVFFDKDVLEHKHHKFHTAEDGSMPVKCFVEKDFLDYQEEYPWDCPGRVKNLFEALGTSKGKDKGKFQLLECTLGDDKTQVEYIDELINETNGADTLSQLKAEMPVNNGIPDVYVRISSVENKSYMFKMSKTLTSCYAAINTTILAVNKVLLQEFLNVYALIRPPGHHASKTQISGYCYFNNLAIGVKHYLRNRPNHKVLIIDWDAHMGDGTMDIFQTNEKVFMLSLHLSDEHFPYKSSQVLNETKNIVSISFETSTIDKLTSKEYLYAFYKIVPFVYELQEADVVFISSGLDLCVEDPVGGCGCGVTLFKYLTSFTRSVVGKDTPLILVHEGGYRGLKNKDKLTSAFKHLLQGFTSNDMMKIKENLRFPKIDTFFKYLDTDYDLKIRYIRHFSKILFPVIESEEDKSKRHCILRSLLKEEYKNNQTQIDTIISKCSDPINLAGQIFNIFQKSHICKLLGAKQTFIKGYKKHLTFYISKMTELWTPFLFLPDVDKENWKLYLNKQGKDPTIIDTFTLESYKNWQRSDKIQFIQLGYCSKCIFKVCDWQEELNQLADQPEQMQAVLNGREEELKKVPMDDDDDFGLHIDAHVQEVMIDEYQDDDI